MAVKEELDVAGQVTTMGGRANVRPADRDAEVVCRLCAAGAVVVGKTNMPELGQWPFTESVAHGITRNPWDTHMTPGGSSGGTAAAVAAGLVAVGLGGDGGGSIRVPAACSGLFGLKPQRGRVTMSPNAHGWWSLSTIGPLTRSPAHPLGERQCGRLRRHPGVAPRRQAECAGARDQLHRGGRRPFTQLRVGWSTTPVTLGVRTDPEHVQAVRETAALLAALGHHVEEVDPGYPDPTAAFVPQFFAGVRTGADGVQHRDRLERRTAETVRLGAWVTPRARGWASRCGEQVAARANGVFAAHVLLTPTIAHRPPEVGSSTGSAPSGPPCSRCRWSPTPLWNVAANSAASVPAGFDRDGLPLAVPLVGRAHDETTLLTVSVQLEAARSWAAARPDTAAGTG